MFRKFSPFLILLSALAVISVAFASSKDSYTALFTTGGVDGYYHMKLNAGAGEYDYSIDLSGFETSCDLSSGLTYHVHSYWTDKESSSVSTCGDTGGHYDPYLACGGSSEDKGALCVSLNRTVDQGYAYGCSAEQYAAGHHALCEVGDIAGKFGRAMPAGKNSKVFSGKLVDPSPPLSVNYAAADQIAKQWASVVFHCPADNARLFCAQFVPDKCGDRKGNKC